MWLKYWASMSINSCGMMGLESGLRVVGLGNGFSLVLVVCAVVFFAGGFVFLAEDVVGFAFASFAFACAIGFDLCAVAFFAVAGFAFATGFFVVVVFFATGFVFAI